MESSGARRFHGGRLRGGVFHGTEEERWVGAQGMASVVRALARGLDIRQAAQKVLRYLKMRIEKKR